MTDNELKPLSKKHQRVLDQYLLCFKQVEAYQKVYTKASYDSARSLSSDLFANTNFSAHLRLRMDELHMSADEAMKLQADIGRGDIGELADENGFFDFGKAKKAGLTKLIRKFKQKTTTFIAKKESEEDREVHELEVELYPADTAHERILKMHGKIKPDNSQIQIVIKYANPDDKPT